ncbi:MAG TPA: acireductone synthase [Rhodanobacteraceae bacterium]|nr:acireductone synthase [Rhodanobacteraceae bacterium]
MSVELTGIRAVLTDIEGTTSSISFVKDVLFPHARAHLPAFVAAHRDDPGVRRWLVATAADAGIDDPDSPRVIDTLLGWIDADVKATPLKALQGMIWKAGYESGAYRAHVYPEVPGRLRDWKSQGLGLYVYSSGSVPAQQLFFGHTEAGNLAPLIDGWFDTETGGKREPASYTHIAAAIGQPAAAIVFLSDIGAELDAARAAGMASVQLCRPPQACADASAHACVADFDAIQLA